MPNTDEQEAAAVAKQLEEQKVARWAIPFVSGIAFSGIDPESPNANGIVVFNQGRVGIAKGNLTVQEGNYNFSGANEVPENATWFSLPFNRAVMLGIFKLVAFSAVIGWPFVAFVLRGTMYTNDKHDPTSGSLFFRFVGWIVSLLVLLVMGALYMLAVRRPELWPGGPAVELSYVLPLAGGLAITTLLGLIGSLLAWARGYWRIPGRLHYTLTIISALGFIWYLSQTGILRQLLEQLQ